MFDTRSWTRRLLLASAASVAACTGSSRPEPVPANRPGSVFFRIEDAPGSAGPARAWLASYSAAGTVARFRIELKLVTPKGDMPMAFTDGAFVREAGSDATNLLRDLATALEAKSPRRPAAVVDRLTFTAALLGQNLSRGQGPDSFAGAFTSKPKGNWITTKVFVADGAGEVFLNLDPVAGVGEFTIKDPDYGDVVVGELTSVFGSASTVVTGGGRAPAGPRTPPPRLPAARPTPRLSVAQLVELLRDADPAVRDRATVSLAEMGPDAREAIPALTAARSDPFPSVRVKAARALARIGDVDTAVEILAATLTDPAGRSAFGTAAAYLGELGPQAKAAVPALISMLEVEVEVSYRSQAIETLGKIGPGARAAVPLLKRFLQDREPFVRDAAANALKAIQGS